MPLPQSLRESLAAIGQVAAELNCQFEGYREFVSIYRIHTNSIIGFQGRFPYYSNCEVIFRIIRFRVKSQDIEEDKDFCTQDLIDLQQVFLPTEEAVECH